jgi:hypothetical protein
METIDRILEREQVSAEPEETPKNIEIAGLCGEVESLSRRLDRLAKMETLLKGKYRKKLESLLDQLNKADGYQNELRSLAKQLKKNKERRAILGKQIADLEKHKKIIRETMKQVTGYEKSSGEQVESLAAEREILCQRVQDLTQMLGIAEQAEL